MRIAAPRNGRNHATLLPMPGAFALAVLIATLVAVLPWQPASAQAAVPCTAISDNEERLACYDRALRGMPAAPTPAAPVPPAPAAQSPAAQPPAPQPPAAQNPAAAAAPRTAPTDERDAAIEIVIVGVRALPGREARFTAQDGTSWVQTDSQRIIGLPDTPFEAELKPGAMGSLFLVPPGRGRAIRVRRADP